MRWLGKAAKETGWMVVGLEADALVFVHGSHASNKPRVGFWAVRPAKDTAADLAKAARDLSLGKYQCTTLLNPGEYQMLVVDAPEVPQAELKKAMRWRLKDMLDYHVDDAMIDVLDIPPDPDGAARAHFMYAVAAPNQVIQSRVKLFEDSRVPLSVIDVPELAQRNIACLWESAETRGVALLHFTDQFGLLTINFKGELYFARRMEIGFSQLAAADERTREDLFIRVLLELQRTLDHFDRQFRFIAISKLVYGPEPSASGLYEYLAANIDIPLERIRLSDAIQFGEGAPDAATEWQLFHHIGASLRNESKVL